MKIYFDREGNQLPEKEASEKRAYELMAHSYTTEGITLNKIEKLESIIEELQIAVKKINVTVEENRWSLTQLKIGSGIEQANEGKWDKKNRVLDFT
jgi:hypothetical protein